MYKKHLKKNNYTKYINMQGTQLSNLKAYNNSRLVDMPLKSVSPEIKYWRLSTL